MESPYQTYNRQIGVRLSYIVMEGHKRYKAHEKSIKITSYDAYEKRARRTEGFRLKQGKGQGNEVLLSWEHLPNEWQHRLKETFGDPKQQIEKSYLEKFHSLDAKAENFYSTYIRPDGIKLSPKLIAEYTANASVLNAILTAKSNRKSWCKSLGGNAQNTWEFFGTQIEAIRNKTGHTLKAPSLRRTVSEYQKQGYAYLISGKLGNQNTAKIKTGENVSLLEELLKKHNNLNNEQIRSLYNMVAQRMGWKLISAGTVGNYREELDLFTYSGRRGETNFRNTRSMQVKRKAPAYPLYYWTLDGWDVELLYQKNNIDAKGNSITTYHNRLTTVIVLDPCCKYPIGYAIGTHETPELIQEALRNAANHTRDLFGNRFKPQQLQSDHYALKTLTPLYEAMTKHFIPARVKNAKAKAIEPYFGHINQKYCQLLPNWSGHGVTASKENQPNTDYLNKIRQQFPDEAGCRAQIEHMIMMERMAKQAEYLAKWEAMPVENRLPLSDEDYLFLFGETHNFTNSLQNGGLITPTLLGQERNYTTFDLKFHELRNVEWAVKYDPADLSQVLVVNASSQGKGRVLDQVIDTKRFLLQEQYVQPMALIERQDGDSTELQKVRGFNKQMEQIIIERGEQNRQVLEEMFISNPQLDGTLTKLILSDSNGQHKNQRNISRAVEAGQKSEAKYTLTQQKQQRKEAMQEKDQVQAMREAYIDSVIDIDNFLNL